MKKQLFNKFNHIFESAMSIITEDWDRFNLDDVIWGTMTATHNFSDPWVKGETGKKVLKLLMSTEHLRANYRHSSGTGEYKKYYDPNSTDNQDVFEIQNNIEEIKSKCDAYWKAKASGGDSFAVKCWEPFRTYYRAINNPAFSKYYKKPTSVDVGFIAYAIYAAYTASARNAERNVQMMSDMNIDEKFKVGSAVTIKLKIIDKLIKSSDFGSAMHLKGTSDEYPGIKFDVVESSKMRKQDIKSFNECPSNRWGQVSDYAHDPKHKNDVGIVVNDVVTFSGKVKSVYKEGKTIFINFASVVKIDSFYVDPNAIQEGETAMVYLARISDEERKKIRKKLAPVIKTTFATLDTEAQKKAIKAFQSCDWKPMKQGDDKQQLQGAILAYDFQNIDLDDPHVQRQIDRVIDLYYEE